MKHSKHFVTIGVPSVFLIFSVLCLTIFSLLTLSTSHLDYQMSERSMNQTDAYYEACTKGTKLYEQATLFLEKNKALDDSLILSKLTETIEDFHLENASAQIYADIPFSTTQKLHIVLQLDQLQRNFQILSWEVSTTDYWEADTKQPIYKGDFS